MLKKGTIILGSLIMLGAMSGVYFSQAANSENYKINADVIGIGGDLGSSASYKLTDTIGEPIVGIGASENYKSKAGFWQMVNTVLSLTVDSNAVNLGAHTPGTPVNGQSTLTVTTDAWGGYDLLVSQDHSLQHTDTVTTIADYSCPISAPCLWSGTGLGFSVTTGTGVDPKWGSTPNFKYAAVPGVDTIFHAKTGYTSGGNNTVVDYKVDTPSTQKSGVYGNTLTYTAIAKL